MGNINLSQQVKTCKLHMWASCMESTLLMWENSAAKHTADLWVKADFQSRTRITVNSWLGVRTTVGRDLFGGCSWVMERMNVHGTYLGTWIWRVSRLIEEERLRGSALGVTYLSSKEWGSCPRIKIKKWLQIITGQATQLKSLCETTEQVLQNSTSKLLNLPTLLLYYCHPVKLAYSVYFWQCCTLEVVLHTRRQVARL